MTKTEIKDKARQKAALKMLQTHKQRNLVKNWSPGKPLAQLAREAGYAETTALHAIHTRIQSPRLKQAIALYHDIKDDGVGIISVGTVLDVQTDEEASRDERLNAAKLGLQIAGKLRNININTSLNANIDISSDDLARVMGINRPQTFIDTSVAGDTSPS